MALHPRRTNMSALVHLSIKQVPAALVCIDLRPLSYKRHGNVFRTKSIGAAHATARAIKDARVDHRQGGLKTALYIEAEDRPLS